MIDTNILVAAARSRRGAAHLLVSLFGRERFETAISVPLALEYEDVLLRQLDRTSLTSDDVGDLLDYICSISHRQEVFYLWRPQLRDPKDDMILELAVAAGCDAIVTYNTKDFESAGDFGISTLKPVDALREIGELK